MAESLGVDYFDYVYAQNDDPWFFATSEYEDLKYCDTLDSLPRSTYKKALEIGCSIGVLTQRLALRCEDLKAIDISAKALAAARARCEQLGNVKFEESKLPVEYPVGNFDLTVLSEVGYYWAKADLARVAEGMIRHSVPGGHLVLVHWTDYVADYPLRGDEVHDYFSGLEQLQNVHGHRKEHYRLDVFAVNSEVPNN